MEQIVHRIRTFRWQAQARSTKQAFAIRQSLNNLWPNMVKVFEDAFNKISDDERIVRIPKIELRIAVKSENDLPDAISRIATQQLQEQLQTISKSQIYQKNISWKISGKQQSRLQNLLHYLKTGSMYWFDNTDSIELQLQKSFLENYEDVINYLFAEKEDIFFYFRLLEILSSDQQESLVGLLSKRVPAKFAQFMILILTKGTNYFSHHTKLKLASAVIRSGLEANYEPMSITDNLLDKSEKLALENFVSILPKKINELRISYLTETETVSESFSLVEGIGKDNIREVESSLKEEDEEKYPFSVSDAGLVLLHPFIPSLFENTGIFKTEGNQQFPSNVLSHAAALLYFLATGREDVHEWELGCIKILLGLRPETPVFVSSGLISVVDKEECKALLESVINHWKALKGTSIEGFQTSFLERLGLIREDLDCWKLQVESKSYDVLLDHLPWNISIVKLPWMKKAIYTEWQAR